MPRIRRRRRQKPKPPPGIRRFDCASYLSCLSRFAHMESPPQNFCHHCQDYAFGPAPITEPEAMGAWRLQLAIWHPPRLPQELQALRESPDLYPDPTIP